MNILEISGLKKSFGKLEVLKGITFSLEKGEVLAIIGSSGSGKSTLLRCLNFLEKANHGTITVNDTIIFDAGKSYGEVEIRQNRLHFGLVFQSFNLFPHYNVQKNIALAPYLQEKSKLAKSFRSMLKADNYNFIKTYRRYTAMLKNINKEINLRSVTLLQKVGLSDKLSNYPCQLSGGQMQRVAIARALALNPDILCFDEPTSALDPELTGEVLKVIRELKNLNSTMIVVTHEMEFARDVADKVIFMANGIIEEVGTPAEVFGSPKSDITKQFLNKYLESASTIRS